MISSQSGIVISGGIFNAVTNSINQTKRGIDLLMEWVATGAFYDSDELYDEPKCHPHTRVVVLDDIMKWIKSDAQDNFMMWFFGPAGAGKSAIAKRIAELAAEEGLLIGTFFFSRASSTRNSKDRLIATLAYQLALSIPGTRTYIQDAINRDPAIFNKNLQIQIDTLLIKPFQSVPAQLIPSPKLIIIDGLDECNNSRAQVSILDAISRSFSKYKPSIICLLVSRPETDIVASFNSNEPLKSIHCRLALDDTYFPDDDIHRFFSDKFEHIRCTHRLKSTIPISWPTDQSLKMLVKKSSGQFIFAATVVKFVESNRHRPPVRLDVILGISPPGTMNPFAELDAFYRQILSSVDDIQLTLRALSLYVAAPDLADLLGGTLSMSAELFLSVEEGDIDLALINLSSIVSYNESSGEVKILHASLIDFLSDKYRSNEFYIDVASRCSDFFCCTLQYVQGPHGIRAGDVDLFDPGVGVRGWILDSRLRSGILDFDLDAFITAMIKHHYKEPRGDYIGSRSVVIRPFYIWMNVLTMASLQAKGDKQLEEAVVRCNKSFESRVQKYQSDWRLRLLPALALIVCRENDQIPKCRCLDILLEMDDHKLHLVDQDALDLRHNQGYLGLINLKMIDKMVEILSRYLDGDRYASAALHCMSFLCKPPKYFESNDSPKMGLVYLEWKATCDMTLNMLCMLLPQANTSPQLVEFMSNHDINSEVRKKTSAVRVGQVDAHILAFLSRACVCVNWRLVFAIRRVSVTIDKPKSNQDARLDEPEITEVTRYSIQERVDQCCNHVWSIRY